MNYFCFAKITLIMWVAELPAPPPPLTSSSPVREEVKANPAPATKAKKSQITKTGYMFKEGGKYKTWYVGPCNARMARCSSVLTARSDRKQRLFVLDAGKVCYYAVQGAKQDKKGEVEMSHVTKVEPAIGAKREFCFEVVTQDRVWKFAASSYEEMTAWVDALRSWVK